MFNYTAINVERKSITAINVAEIFARFLEIFVQRKGSTSNIILPENSDNLAKMKKK